MNNLEEFVWDMYANHIVRSCMACLCGEPYLSSKNSSKDGKKINTTKDHKSLLKKYADNILNFQQFPGKRILFHYFKYFNRLTFNFFIRNAYH